MSHSGTAEVTEGADDTLGTFRLAGDANGAAVEGDEVAEDGAVGRRDEVVELEFDFVGVGLLREADAIGDALEMGVDDDTRGGETLAEDDVGGLAADARERGEGVHGGGDPSVEARDDIPGAAEEAFGFLTEEAGGADEGFKVSGVGLGEGGGVGVSGEEGRGDEVDAGVGTLSGEDGGGEELEGVSVVEHAAGVGVFVAEQLQDLARAVVE